MSLLGWKRPDTGMLLPISGAEVMYAASRFVKYGVQAGIRFQARTTEYSSSHIPLDILFQHLVMPSERYATSCWLNRGMNGLY